MSHELKFSPTYLKNLIDEKKDDDAKTYLNKFFYRSGVNVFFYDGDGFILYDLQTALKLIPDDLVRYRVTEKKTVVDFSPKSYMKSIEFQERDFKPIVNFITEERVIEKKRTIKGIEVTDRYVNMSKALPFDNTKKISRKKYEKKLDLIYNHIKSVLCSDNEDLYEYFLNFIACTFAGRKLRKAIYAQSLERTGKGIIISLISSILGARMYKTSNPEEILKYNKNFEGRCFINLDEMPVDNTNYRSIGDTMKSLITEAKFGCRDMFSKPYEQDNTFNFIITTNNDAISLTQTNQARYVVLDISEHRLNDHEYFKNVASAVNTEDVRILFYRDMMNRYELLTAENWNEDLVPKTIAKQKKIIEALPAFHKWIKEKYVLTNQDISYSTVDFFEKYYEETHDRTSKQKLSRYIKDCGIVMTRIGVGDNRHYVYRASNEQLKDAFVSKGWIDEDVDHFNEKDDTKATSFTSSVLEDNETLLKRIAQLEAKLKQYEKNTTKTVLKKAVSASKKVAKD